jgi:cytochrome c peroxidase
MKPSLPLRLLAIFIPAAALLLLQAGKPGTKSQNFASGFYAKMTGDQTLTDKEKLGKLLFFDKSLSTPEGQACSTCHDPSVAFTDPGHDMPVSKGAIQGRFGNRNDMTVSYAAFVPPLHYDKEEEVWTGGLFWDGRSNSLADQAMGPPLNHLEMANPDKTAILKKLKALSYSDLFIRVYGSGALADPDKSYEYFADAIAAYEKTPEVNPFSSKFDQYLAGKVRLTEQEARGLDLFVDEKKGNCAACHPATAAGKDTPPLFTDFTYDNLGVPVNASNPFLYLPKDLNPDGTRFIDEGLALVVKDKAHRGKFRVPTLRNVAVTAPYMHNGIFYSLWEVVSFYNSRDIAPWPKPEVPETVNREELGNLGLTNAEVEDIIVFLRTLTDGWQAGM